MKLLKVTLIAFAFRGFCAASIQIRITSGWIWIGNLRFCLYLQFSSENRPIPGKASRDESEEVNKWKDGQERRERIMMGMEREKSQEAQWNSWACHFLHEGLKTSSDGDPRRGDQRKSSRNVSG
jgi:hypothetical protein